MLNLLPQLLGWPRPRAGCGEDEVKTITVIMEVEYTCSRPDSVRLAQAIESKLIRDEDFGGGASRAIVRVISETR